MRTCENVATVIYWISIESGTVVLLVLLLGATLFKKSQRLYLENLIMENCLLLTSHLA